MKEFNRISKEIEEIMNLDNYLANIRNFHINALIEATNNKDKKLIYDEQCIVDIYQKHIDENEVVWDAKLKEMKDWIDANETKNQLN